MMGWNWRCRMIGKNEGRIRHCRFIESFSDDRCPALLLTHRPDYSTLCCAIVLFSTRDIAPTTLNPISCWIVLLGPTLFWGAILQKAYLQIEKIPLYKVTSLNNFYFSQFLMNVVLWIQKNRSWGCRNIAVLALIWYWMSYGSCPMLCKLAKHSPLPPPLYCVEQIGTILPPTPFPGRRGEHWLTQSRHYCWAIQTKLQ